MSEQEKRKQEKANTEAWKQKMAKKKQEKQMKKETGQPVQKNDKKKKKDKLAKKEEAQKVEQPTGPIIEELVVTVQKNHPPIKTVEGSIYKENPQLYDNHEFQYNLLLKSLASLLHQNNWIIHVAENQKKTTLNNQDLSSIIKCCFIHIPGFTSNITESNAQMICRYEDTAFILEQVVDKLIIQANIVFANGSILAKKGTLNMILMAKHFKVITVGYCGSWRYCGQTPSSFQQLQICHRKQILDDYDWINSELLNVIVLESGPLLPNQININVMQGYQRYGIKSLSW